MAISRAHRGSHIPEEDHKNSQDLQSPKSIFVQFNNWRIAEEIRNTVIRETCK